VFLLSCGDDYSYVKYNFEHPENPSIVQPYLPRTIHDKNFTNMLKYRTKSFEKLHHYIFQNIKGAIASDLDYHIPLESNPKYLGLVPNPINTDHLIEDMALGTGKIIIFHGINRESYYKKGSNYFEEALQIIQQKYSEKVEALIVENVPYQDYITLYNKAHIMLDQLYGHDQGYNGLEAMAKGKVLFTNASEVFEKHYHLTEKVAINGLPNVDYLVKELSYLIENPSEIVAISKRARLFIEKEHNYIKIAAKYIEVWDKAI
jgi:glycosyltransferase involved in cell wall biosynthesis